MPLLERRPHLLLPVAALMLPPAQRPDPGDLLGIDFSRMRTAEEIADAMGRVVGAMGRGEIMPGEAKRLTRRARKALRPIRRLMRREITLLKAQRRAAEKAAGKFPVKRAKIPCSEGISERVEAGETQASR